MDYMHMSSEACPIQVAVMLKLFRISFKIPHLCHLDYNWLFFACSSDLIIAYLPIWIIYCSFILFAFLKKFCIHWLSDCLIIYTFFYYPFCSTCTLIWFIWFFCALFDAENFNLFILSIFFRNQWFTFIFIIKWDLKNYLLFIRFNVLLDSFHHLVGSWPFHSDDLIFFCITGEKDINAQHCWPLTCNINWKKVATFICRIEIRVAIVL